MGDVVVGFARWFCVVVGKLGFSRWGRGRPHPACSSRGQLCVLRSAFFSFLFVRLCVTISLRLGGAERLGVITGRIVLLDFYEFVDAVRGIF